MQKALSKREKMDRGLRKGLILSRRLKIGGEVCTTFFTRWCFIIIVRARALCACVYITKRVVWLCRCRANFDEKKEVLPFCFSKP
jgi:hypothetical protein